MAEVTVTNNRVQFLRYGGNTTSTYASNFGTGNNYAEGSQLLQTGSTNYWIAHLDSGGHAYLSMTNNSSCQSLTCPFKKSISYTNWSSWSNSWRDYFDTDFSQVELVTNAPVFPYFELTPYTSTVDGQTYYTLNPRDIKFTVEAPTDIASILAGGRVLIEPYSFTYTESESSSSSDYSTISSAIMMIPATMFCLAFFFIIFKLFINKRVRG